MVMLDCSLFGLASTTWCVLHGHVLYGLGAESNEGELVCMGAQEQAAAFREGFSKVFPISDLRAFTADELVLLFGNGDEDWSIESMYLGR